MNSNDAVTMQDLVNMMAAATAKAINGEGVDPSLFAGYMNPNTNRQNNDSNKNYTHTPHGVIEKERGFIKSNSAKVLMKSYNDQWLQKHTVAGSNQMQLFYAEGGLFTACDLEQPIINAVLNPRSTMLNILPMRTRLVEERRYAYVTQITEATAGPGTTVCEDCPSINDIATCESTWRVGRVCYETRTGEIDSLIRRANIGVRDDLFFLGDMRGINNTGIDGTLLQQDANLVRQGALRFQFFLLGRAFERLLAAWVWIADPNDAQQNTNPGAQTNNDAWKSFYGLDLLISADYGTPALPFVTGTNCAALNSVVFDFSTVGTGKIGTDPIYQVLQEMEQVLFDRAQEYGLDPAFWVLAMHPRQWTELVKYLPCEMITDGCTGTDLTTDTSGQNPMWQMAERQRLVNSRMIQLNGRMIDVFLDDFLPYTTTATPGEVVASIYFVPLQVVGGTQTLWMEHYDYNAFTNALDPIPAEQPVRGWTDGGRFHSVVIYDGRCFKVNTKIEPTLIFLAPHLAGRIDNVTTCPTYVINNPVLPPGYNP